MVSPTWFPVLIIAWQCEWNVLERENMAFNSVGAASIPFLWFPAFFPKGHVLLTSLLKVLSVSFVKVGPNQTTHET